RRRNVAHRIIEEFMIAANRAVGAHLTAKKAPSMYRVHERPEPTRVAKLADAIAGLGYKVPEPYENVGPKDLGAITEAARGRPEEPFIQRLVLRTMALARYDPECLGHFGLALRRYLHFTSPIRRYPDLVVHRALARLSSGEKLPGGERQELVARMPELARECSRLEREAELAERESIAWKVASFMADRLGDEFSGRIVDIAPHGVTVSIDDPYVEGLIPIRRLGEEYFRYDERRRSLVGSDSGQSFRLGQEVSVRLDRVDLMRHFIDFSLADTEPERGGRRTKRKRGDAPERKARGAPKRKARGAPKREARGAPPRRRGKPRGKGR
ncbi:MAG: RNB domain-containing ribonuclease, partial [Acidobacteriota bacterium]|nr:RNB domain-containing ribonuclease [Acidobacteriota bacterium]